MYQISKSFSFESAHRLYKPYVGKCANIHGHSWNGKITIKSDELDSYGFVLDFSHIKNFIKIYVDKLDHAIFLNTEDKELIEFSKKIGSNVILFDGNPTSEIIARSILENVEKYLKNNFLTRNITVESVELSETCTSSCKVSK